MRATIGNLKEIYLKAYSKDSIAILFISLMVISALLFVWLSFLSEGKSLGWAFFNDHHDTFMDYFNSVMYSSDHPYSKYKVIYPPLVTIAYSIIGYLTIPFTVDVTGQSLAFDLRDSQASILLYSLISIATFYLLHVLVNKMMRDKYSRIVTEGVFLTVLFSYPILFGFERGNSIIFATLLCMLFLLGYDSENKWVRCGSCIALGCATGIKIFPALLAVLFLHDRQWKNFLTCVIIVAVLLLLPFLFTDGNPIMLLSTILSYSPTTSAAHGILNFYDLVAILGIPRIVGTVLSLGTAILCFLTIVLKKKLERWKMIGLVCSAFVMCFSIGSQYLMVYMLPPLLFFLRDEHEPNTLNITYTLLFVIMFMLMPGFLPASYVVIGTIKVGAAFLFMVILYADCFGMIKTKSRGADNGQI